MLIVFSERVPLSSIYYSYQLPHRGSYPRCLRVPLQWQMWRSYRDPLKSFLWKANLFLVESWNSEIKGVIICLFCCNWRHFQEYLSNVRSIYQIPFRGREPVPCGYKKHQLSHLKTMIHWLFTNESIHCNNFLFQVIITSTK